VDDDESVLSGLGAILEAHEFDVTTAGSVVEALEHITRSPFDVLLSDLHMPGAGDGLIVVGAMRHANPKAVTLILSANPDMGKASTAMLRQVDEIILKPVKAVPIIEAIRHRLAEPGTSARTQVVEAVATVLERERAAIARAWLTKMKEADSFTGVPLNIEVQGEHLPELLNEIVYRLRYPQPLGLMTLFSMASLQHGARRRRQGFRSPVLVEEARALQVALFQTIQSHLDGIDLGQLLQSLSGYENEKPVEFGRDDR
jgi:CheY-like chemotaxis protein